MDSSKPYRDIPEIFGTWENQAKELKAKYPELTDEDLLLVKGEEKALVRRMEARLNKKRDEVVHIIKKTQTEKF